VKLPLLFAVVDDGVILALLFAQSERSWTIYEFARSGVQPQPYPTSPNFGSRFSRLAVIASTWLGEPISLMQTSLD
jgi:hypothetical protein